MFLYRLCFRLVSFAWGLYPWAPALSEEAHWTGTSPLASCGLCRVCSVDECSLCFTLKLPGWENHVNEATVKSACNRLFFLYNQFIAQHELCALIWWCTELSWVMLTGRDNWDPDHWDLWKAKGSSSAAPVCACEQFLVPQLRASSGPRHGSGWGFNSVIQTFVSELPECNPGLWSHSRRSGIGRSDSWTSPLCFFKIPGFNLGRSLWKGKEHRRLFQFSLLEHQDLETKDLVESNQCFLQWLPRGKEQKILQERFRAQPSQPTTDSVGRRSEGLSSDR